LVGVVGAVAGFRIANKLFEVMGKSIKVNIFAIDPVAGGPHKLSIIPSILEYKRHQDDDIYAISPNVRNYWAVLDMHDVKLAFEHHYKDMIIRRGGGRRVGYLHVMHSPIPGSHMMMVDPTTGPSLLLMTYRSEAGKDIYTLVRSLATHFLRAHDSMITGDDKVLGQASTVETYS